MGPDAFVDHCAELLAPLGAVRSCRMFGGHGLYVDGIFIAIVAFDTLYLKAGADTRGRFEAADCAPFVYSKSSQAVSLGYWSAPAEAMESAALMAPWGRLALQAALAARAAVKPRAAAARKRGARPAR